MDNQADYICGSADRKGVRRKRFRPPIQPFAPGPFRFPSSRRCGIIGGALSLGSFTAATAMQTGGLA